MDADDKPQEIAQRATAAGTAALLGVAVGGPVGAVVGAAAIPLLEPFMARVWDEVRADGRSRAAAAMQTAIEALGESPEEFELRVQESEQTRLLAATAMDASARTAWQAKVRALGRALAAGLAGDSARVDEEQLIVSALAELEAPHVRVLDLLITRKWEYAYRTKESLEGTWAASELLSQEMPPRRYPSWTAEQIGSALPYLAPIVATVLGTLQRHGLAVPRYDLSETLDNLVTDN